MNGTLHTVTEYTTTVSIDPIPGFQPRLPPPTFKTYETTEGLSLRWTSERSLVSSDGRILHRLDPPQAGP